MTTSPPWVDDGEWSRRLPGDADADADNVLPGDYDGFILVTDIDDTLRHTSLRNVVSSRFRQRHIRRVRRALFVERSISRTR
jgi:phosphatidate phosphatase APP1